MDQTKTLSTKFRYRNIFTKKDESDPKIWGPKMWKHMFTVAASYPKTNPTQTQKDEVYKFFKNLQLPCIQCQQSYTLFWNQVPIQDYLSSRKLLIEWVYIIKDKVNKKLIMQEKNNEAIYTRQCLAEDPTRMDFCVEYGRRKQAFHTTPPPPLRNVLNRYLN
jgi:hypothetical protein